MPSGLDNGYGSPFVRVYYKDKELSVFIASFEYEYDEEGDDVCKLEIKVDVRNEADEPQWQEKAQLKVIWGYIQGEISDSRKIFIQQIKWEFNKDAITANIEATPKAISMKYSDSTEVHTNTSLPGMALKMANKHNLKAQLEVNDDHQPEFISPTKPGEYFDNYLIRNSIDRGLRDSAKLLGEDNVFRSVQNIDIDKPLVDHLEGGKKNLVTNPLAPTPKSQPFTVQKDGTFTPSRFSLKPGDFNIYDNLPQANKTDAQMLSDLATREKNGPYIVDTRDDTITIKKRNFNQTPYKAYIFGGDEGALYEFSPMSKNKSHRHSAKNVGFSNWNPLDKTAYTGNANGLSDNNKTLATFKEAYKFYSNAANKGLGTYRLGDMQINKINGFIGGTNVQSNIDNSAVYDKVRTYSPFTVNDAVSALKKTIDQYDEVLNNNTYNPLANNMEDAYNQAESNRKQHELKMNPANATLYGDPYLKVGKLITILAVSKKYSMNYYITKANHKIDKSGYVTKLDMVTHGHNIKASSDDIRSLGKVNRSVGPGASKSKTRKAKIKTNP